MKKLSERLTRIRDTHERYRSTHDMANAMVPMIQHAEAMQARIKELEEALACCEHAMNVNQPRSVNGEEWTWGDVHTHARAILNKKPTQQ